MKLPLKAPFNMPKVNSRFAQRNTIIFHHDLLLTQCALDAYLKFHFGEAEQRFVEEYFSIGTSVLRRARQRAAAEDQQFLARWSTRRKGLAKEHFACLPRLFGLEIGLAVAALHAAVTTEATGTDPATAITALEIGPAPAIRAAAARLVERLKLPHASRDEIKALCRRYLAEHSGVPVGPLSAVTGLTGRILLGLRPPLQSRETVRNDYWKETFKHSPDFPVWSTLRAEAGRPLNGWR